MLVAIRMLGDLLSSDRWVTRLIREAASILIKLKMNVTINPPVCAPGVANNPIRLFRLGKHTMIANKLHAMVDVIHAVAATSLGRQDAAGVVLPGAGIEANGGRTFLHKRICECTQILLVAFSTSLTRWCGPAVSADLCERELPRESEVTVRL